MLDFCAELESNLPVYEGGPVEVHNIYYIHKRPDLIANSEKSTMVCIGPEIMMM